MKETIAPTTPLSSLEISGAICARVIHNLANLISGVVGNAEYAQDPAVDAANMQKAIKAISTSANAAGKLLGQCLPLQRLLSGESFPYDTSELACLIAESSGLAPGWRVLEPSPPLTRQVKVQPRWLSAAIWQIAREADTSLGEIEFGCGPAVFPVVWHGANPSAGGSTELFQIHLRYRGDQALFTAEGPANPERLGLLAAHELLRRFKGQIQARSTATGRQEISLLIPLI